MFDSIRKFMIVEEDEKPAVKADDTKLGIVVNAGPLVGNGSADDELIAKITSNVKDKDADNAYFKLRTSMDLMIANKLDECSAAKGSAAVLGIQAATALPAIDSVIAAVEGERTIFTNSAYKNAIAAADALTAHATDLQTQINELLEQVKQLSEENINTQQEATKAKADAELMAATFDASAAKLINILTSEKIKLTTYLS